MLYGNASKSHISYQKTSIKANFDTYGFEIVLFEEFIDLFMDSILERKI